MPAFICENRSKDYKNAAFWWFLVRHALLAVVKRQLRLILTHCIELWQFWSLKWAAFIWKCWSRVQFLTRFGFCAWNDNVSLRQWFENVPLQSRWRIFTLRIHWNTFWCLEGIQGETSDLLLQNRSNARATELWWVTSDALETIIQHTLVILLGIHTGDLVGTVRWDCPALLLNE